MADFVAALLQHNGVAEDVVEHPEGGGDRVGYVVEHGADEELGDVVVGDFLLNAVGMNFWM